MTIRTNIGGADYVVVEAEEGLDPRLIFPGIEDETSDNNEERDNQLSLFDEYESNAETGKD